MGNTGALIIGTRHRDISTAIPICHAPCGKLGFRAIVALLGRMEVLLQVPRDTAQGLQIRCYVMLKSSGYLLQELTTGCRNEGSENPDKQANFTPEPLNPKSSAEPFQPARLSLLTTAISHRNKG